MKMILGWTLKILGGLALLLCITAAVIWFAAQANLDQKFTPVERPFSALSGDIDLAEGERLAHIVGCTGCHGSALEGKVMFESPMFARIVAPNLTRIANRYSDQQQPTPDRAEQTPFYEGEYLTQIKCAECHGRDLKGAPFGLQTTPSLVTVTGYTTDEFTAFMRTGVAKDGRNVGLMSEISATHFKYLRDEEISDLYEFIKSRDWL